MRRIPYNAGPNWHNPYGLYHNEPGPETSALNRFLWRERVVQEHYDRVSKVGHMWSPAGGRRGR